MSKLLIEDTTLTAIGDAIRAKTGDTELIAPGDMPYKIATISGGEIPADKSFLTGDCRYQFAYDHWNWFLEEYGDKIITSKITKGSYMFDSNPLESIPFDIDLAGYGNSMFAWSGLKVAPKLTGTIGYEGSSMSPTIERMFYHCNYLKEIPEPELDFGYLDYGKLVGSDYIFDCCYSLRSIPVGLMKMLSAVVGSAFRECYSLDEVVNLPVYIEGKRQPDFYSTFSKCGRLKNMIFATQEDGSPYVATWNDRTLRLDDYVGYVNDATYILDYNSGITSNKEVTNDTTYQLLKDDPDWYTTNIAYSRYNHDSAVATINSLPDTKAYLTANGGTNTIKFTGAAGSRTDGGAINTLTAAEIAVATTKGWTVTLV